MRSCDFEGCGRKHDAKGLCSGHYQQRVSGRPLTPLRRYLRGDTAERIALMSTDCGAGCRMWTASLDAHGYAQINVGGTNRRAHRVAWELAHGGVQRGNVVDHKCGNRACVNLEHLREVPHKENIQYRTRLSANNTSGYRGVSLRRDTGRYTATVVVSGESFRLGCFDTAAEAGEAATEFRSNSYKLGEFEEPNE